MAGLSCKRPYPLLLVCGFLLLSQLTRLSAVEESGGGAASADGGEERPLVFLAVLARNQEHTLPNYLGYIEHLDYPKDRISVWIRTDHNNDSTAAVLQQWSENVRGLYANVDFHHSEEWLYPTSDPFANPEEKYVRVAQLRQAGLDAAREVKADYLFWVDCGNFLVNNRTLTLLIEQHKPIVAPMMETGNGSSYSNFWCGQRADGYYKRTPDYMPTLTRERVGCFEVPVVLSTFLVDLRSEGSQRLVYWPLAVGFTGPVDDIVQFAFSAKKEGLGMYVLNTEPFGYMSIPHYYPSLEVAAEDFLNFKLKTLVFYPPIPVSEHISLPEIPKDNLGLDAVFMISLVRRPKRRNRMLACLEELHFNYTIFDAVDGRELNQSFIDGLGIRYLPGWKDPWGERPMTFGEVGCFLSHYTIWQKLLSEDMQQVLVLEDDVDFDPDFRQRLRKLLNEAQQFTPDWDLIYIGRKVLYWKSEKMVPGTTILSRPDYSYWTLGYLLSHSGAEKLINARPFDHLLPVDEYFPIMYNKHPELDWASHFPNKNLNVFSSFPLLVHPTHYVGDDGWFSDTEPPMEILQKIRERKLKEEQEEDETLEQQEEHRNRIKEQAQQRIIESMRAKLNKVNPKTEL